jgi:aldehyde:ferredoxin oxidoreductase
LGNSLSSPDTTSTDGGSEGHLPDLGQMLNEYYQARGWNENGVPSPEKLRSLSINMEQ